MTIDQFIKKQEAILEKIVKQDTPLAVASRDTMTMQAERIFVDGGDSSGGSIGKYSKEPYYVNPLPQRFPKQFAPKGKDGKKKFKNGKDKKTRYLKDGYFEFRKLQGRQNAFVDLSMSGDLQSDFANNPGISAKLPANIKPIMVTVHHYKTTLKREANIDKKDGAEDRFGTIFKLTKAEVMHFRKILALEFKKLFA